MRKSEEKAKPQKAMKPDHPTRRPKRPGTVKHRSGYGKAYDAWLAGVKRGFTLIEVLLTLIIVGILVFCFAYGIALIITEQRCLQLGYPHAQVSVALECYCIKRVDQTDVVVPLP